MSSFKLEPPKAGLEPREYRKYVKDTILTEIARLGEENVLEHKDFVILFSGPSRVVRVAVGNNPESNNKKSLRMAIEFGASRINDTQAAISLDGHDLEDYFEPILSKQYPDPDMLATALDAAYANVWGGISELFAELDFKTVATAVCGAGEDRVFVRDELPSLVKNSHVETINGIDMQAVRDMYEISPDEAFKLVCLSELKMTFMKAKHGAKRPIEAWNDFYERERFYKEERKIPKLVIVAPTKELENRRQEIITKHGLEYLYASAPASWGGPVTPRPSTLPSVMRKFGLH